MKLDKDFQGADTRIPPHDYQELSYWLTHQFDIPMLQVLSMHRSIRGFDPYVDDTHELAHILLGLHYLKTGQFGVKNHQGNWDAEVLALRIQKALERFIPQSSKGNVSDTPVLEDDFLKIHHDMKRDWDGHDDEALENQRRVIAVLLAQKTGLAPGDIFAMANYHIKNLRAMCNPHGIMAPRIDYHAPHASWEIRDTRAGKAYRFSTDPIAQPNLLPDDPLFEIYHHPDDDEIQELFRSIKPALDHIQSTLLEAQDNGQNIAVTWHNMSLKDIWASFDAPMPTLSPSHSK